MLQRFLSVYEGNSLVPQKGETLEYLEERFRLQVESGLVITEPDSQELAMEILFSDISEDKKREHLLELRKTGAQRERELIIERTRVGLDVARQRGRVGGRKRQMTDSKIESAKKLLNDGIPPKEVAQNLGVSILILYRWLPAYERSLPP